MSGKDEQSDSHRSVGKVLTRLAERLKEEGVILGYNRKAFTIPTREGWPDLRISPDLVLQMPDKKKVLVEVVNPKDPKRFIGEIVYPQLLAYHKEISAALFYVIHTYKHKHTHQRSFGESLLIYDVFKERLPIVAQSWFSDEDTVYNNLKTTLTSDELGLPLLYELYSEPMRKEV